ncbi:condensation domain-containing protein [Crossiella sp. CA-258035]|uniref:condensation domain-containing protein n=1 Tax=Crossiella sp. CA-258035 TaxID=2981138 RepID=UPI0024BCCBF0|nr:condensation domain-containing protein [Crossiella sp. CA-258035]WHT16208.1 condensation domain-containing protein [Crossiella sp. CA-258035]
MPLPGEELGIPFNYIGGDSAYTGGFDNLDLYGAGNRRGGALRAAAARGQALGDRTARLRHPKQDRLAPACPPLLRAHLMRLAPRRHVLLLSLHHAVVDGWSLSVLFGELFRHCAGQPLAPAPSFAAHLNWLARQDRAAATRTWAELLDDAKPTLFAPPLAEDPALLPHQHTLRLSAPRGP